MTNGVFTASSGVVFGFVPASGQMIALAELDGDVTIDTNTDTTTDPNALTFSGSGTLSAIISGKSISLLTGGLGTTSIVNLVKNGLSQVSSQSIKLAGTDFTLDSIQLNSSGPEIQLQGSIALPKPIGLTVKVDGANDVDISPSGVSLTGVDAALSGSFTVAGQAFHRV